MTSDACHTLHKKFCCAASKFVFFKQCLKSSNWTNLSQNPIFSVVVWMLHHCYIRYSNAKCDPLFSVVLFLGLVPPTLFSIRIIKMKKNLCVCLCSFLCVLLLCSVVHTVCIYVSVCVFVLAVGLILLSRALKCVCHDCILTLGIGLSAVLIQAQQKDDEEEEKEEEEGACCF